ncbi:MAG TPA: GNAT family N-acetyltransferase [Polyangiaceae bacterium]|nr:GNAT family N-acetyltransferase [Polyangiaceae bacterium]
MTIDSGPAVLRTARETDVETLIALNRLCFPTMPEHNVVWNRGQLNNHLRVFPEGQLVVEAQGRIVGAISSLIVHLGADPYRAHTYAGITDGGFFHNHDPQGDTLYGADVYVHPEFRGRGVGHVLYEARRELCKQLNLRRILAGGRIHNYQERAASLTPEEYVRQVEMGERRDLVLSFQLREGFVVRGILRNYVQDPQSANCATLIEWQNPDYRAPDPTDVRKVRVAAVQYQVRRVRNFDDFATQVEYFVGTAAGYRADFVMFPELFSMQLLSEEGLQKLPAIQGISRLAELERPFFELMSRLAREYGIHIVAGTHPIARNGRIYNVSPLFFPTGESVLQPKLHITPAERLNWGITGGDELRVIVTPKAKVGILVCYDAEFPEAARYLADQGAEILFVPYCTDNRAGHLRVRYCCQARAIENQVFVVTAGVIGNLPSVAAMDIHYGQAAVYTPSDFAFARDGVQAQADSNVEMLLVTDLDISDLYRSRSLGSVTPSLDRRKDLFEFRTRLKNEPGELPQLEALPLELLNDPHAQ